MGIRDNVMLMTVYFPKYIFVTSYVTPNDTLHIIVINGVS